jgi:hypothetical protein
VQLQLLVDAQAAHLLRIADIERDMGSSTGFRFRILCEGDAPAPPSCKRWAAHG